MWAIGATGKILKNKINKNNVQMHKKKSTTEIIKLRKELNKLLANNGESSQQSPSFSVNIEKAFIEKLTSIKDTPPSNYFLRNIYRKGTLICKEFSLHLGPECPSCQNNTLSLPF